MTKKKSLQKLTKIESLSSKKEVKEFLQNNPKKEGEVIEFLHNRLFKSYNEKLGLEDETIGFFEALSEVTNNLSPFIKLKNTTYEINHTKITDCIHNYISNNRNFPMIHTISGKTGLSRQTVYKHLKSGLKNEFNSIVKGKNEIMSMQALQQLYLIGIQDRNASALKHFIQLSGGANNSTTNVNNYIQINNLKISNEDFNKLPTETILEVEAIISKSIEEGGKINK
jgi:hypothetical protein